MPMNPYYWNTANVYEVSPAEQTMEMGSVARRRPLHAWVTTPQQTEEVHPDPESTDVLWPVSFPQAYENLSDPRNR